MACHFPHQLYYLGRCVYASFNPLITSTNSSALFRSQSASAFSFLLCRMTSKTYRSWLWSLSKKPELLTFPLSSFSCYNWTWIQVFVGIEKHFTCADFPFWSWLRPRPCQIFIERSLGHFLHCAEALTSPQEWQPHVAFNGWTLQSTADLIFAKGAPRRKQKAWPGLCPGGSLSAVQQWTGLSIFSHKKTVCTFRLC